MPPPRSPYRKRLRVESLEDRRMLAVITVDTELDTVDLNDGVTSLREAIVAANTVPGADEIVFDFGHNDPAVILIDNELPTITDALTITGPGMELLTIDAQHGADGEPGTEDGWRVVGVHAGSDQTSIVVEIDGLTIRGSDTGSGSAVANWEYLRISNSRFVSNHGNDGGAIWNRGQLETTHNLLEGNSAERGGAVFSGSFSAYGSDNDHFDANSATLGGAIFSASEVVLTSTFLSGNRALADGGAVHATGRLTVAQSTLAGNEADRRGGAMHAVGIIAVLNSTLSANSADEGAAIYCTARETTLYQSTVYQNLARRSSGAAIYATGFGSVEITNSIVAETRDLFGDLQYDIEGDFVSSYTLVGAIETGHEDHPTSAIGELFLASIRPSMTTQVGRVAPGLGPLADNGGPTPTHALLPGSLAIDSGDPSASGDGEYDQRGGGYHRVADGGAGLRIDIGAYEAQAEPWTAPGDFNGDRVFDTADYSVWRDNYGRTVDPLAPGDADGDGVVDTRDLDRWRARFGDTYFASEVVVNDLGDFDDEDHANGVTTLREAINLSAFHPEVRLITFSQSLSGGTILMGSHGPVPAYDIMSDLTIDARGLPEGLTIDAHDRLFMFDIAYSVYIRELDSVTFDVTFAGLTLANSHGFAVGSRSRGHFQLIESSIVAGAAAQSAGIVSYGPVTLIDSEIEGARRWDIHDFGRGTGGVSSESDVTLIRSSIRNTINAAAIKTARAKFRGGPPDWYDPNPEVTLVDSLITGTAIFGGVVEAFGDVRLERSRIDHNIGTAIVANDGHNDGEYTGNVTLVDSFVSNNTAFGGEHAGAVGQGGVAGGAGIVAARDVSLLRSRVENNVIDSSRYWGTHGGGVASRQQVTIVDSYVGGNAAEFGGGVYAEGLRDDNTFDETVDAVTVVDSEVSRNFARYGAAILSEGNVTISGSLLEQNQTYNGVVRTGTVEVRAESMSSRDVTVTDSTLRENYGLGLWSVLGADRGNVTLLRSNVVDNSTSGVRRAELIVDSVISGNAGLGVSMHGEIVGSTISNNGDTGVYVEPSATVLIRDSVISNNRPTGSPFSRGGGVYGGGVTLLNTVVSGNKAAGRPGRGGAGVNSNSLTAVDSTIRDNVTTGDQAPGGGVFTGQARLYRTTVSDNETRGAGAHGGGVYSSALIAVQSTISGNRVEGEGSNGGGVFVLNSAELRHSTIADNHALAPDAVGGGLHFAGEGLQSTGTIFAGNIAATAPDVFSDGAPAEFDFNLLGDSTGSNLPGIGAGNVLDVDPLLGPLANHGGATHTHALLPDSPAFDAGDPNAAAIPFTYFLPGMPPVMDPGDTDQRGPGFLRVSPGGIPGSGRIDIGAYESQGVPSFPDGDYNGDGFTDSADFTLWRETLGSTTDLRADGDGDGKVTIDDYHIWRENFGATLVLSPPPAVGNDSAARSQMLSAPASAASFDLRNEAVADRATRYLDDGDLLLLAVQRASTGRLTVEDVDWAAAMEDESDADEIFGDSFAFGEELPRLGR